MGGSNFSTSSKTSTYLIFHYYDDYLRYGNIQSPGIILLYTHDVSNAGKQVFIFSNLLLYIVSDMNSSDSYNMEMAFGPGGLSGAGGNGGGPGSGHQRTKRMRTSFKHHQLRTMKSYFHHNHNPDAKDLKQLSQKTGLPKRVLQVRIIVNYYIRTYPITEGKCEGGLKSWNSKRLYQLAGLGKKVWLEF